MSRIDELNKDELKLVVEELGLTAPESAKVIELRNIIEKSDNYKNEKFIESLANYAVEEIKSRKEKEKNNLELERIKLSKLEKEIELANIRKEAAQNQEFERIKLLQMEKQLELAKIQNETAQSTSSVLKSEIETENNNLENLIKSVKTLTISVPSRAESFNLFFQSLEKAFKTKNVPDKFKAEILLNILGDKTSNLMIYVSEDDLGNYEKMKTIVLKEFQPTPQECLNNFRKAQKMPYENYVQFASRLAATFDYYCQLRNVNDFKSLCELMVSDRIYNSLDRDLMSHIAIKQEESFFKPPQLGRECDLFISARGKPKFESTMFTKTNGNEKRVSGNKLYNSRAPNKASNVFLSEVKNNKCKLCINEFHSLNYCPQFKKLSIKDRVEVVKVNKACYKCLRLNCYVKNCVAKNCSICNLQHHFMIHYTRNEIENKHVAPNEGSQTIPPPPDGNAFVASSLVKNKTKNVLLSTARILIKDKFSNWQEIRVILDVGSQSCLLSKQCANRLQLKINKTNTLISCLGDSSMQINGCVETEISSKNHCYEKQLNMLVVNKITDLIPQRVLNINIEMPDLIMLADKRFNIPGKIDALIGAEVFYELLRPGQIYSQNSNLVYQNTVFGYVASGSVEQGNEVKLHCGLIRDDDLNKTLKKFWEVENVEVEVIKSKEHVICEENFVRTHKRDEQGKYIVKMPLRENPECLGQSREIALKRLKSLWCRLSKDDEYLKLYKEFLSDYESMGHMREVIETEEPSAVYYAPHHGVYRPEKRTTKLRVVFNCSAKTTAGNSLNSLQYNGGVIQRDLISLMIAFREYIYAFTADIKMMYRMIKIDESQYSLQRILWSQNPAVKPKTYELLTVTYGTVSAPYLAMRTLQQLAEDEGINFPKAAVILRENFYMDDVLSGAATLADVKELQRQLIAILQRGGMQLHKWCTNYEFSLNPGENYAFENETENKTLGVYWNPKEDCFSFRVTAIVSESYTKREVLSTIARIFDPLGLLGPVIAKAKIIMQKLWRIDIDWSDTLPESEYLEWHQFLINLQAVNDIKVERRTLIKNHIVIEIHGFSDASERCYGAVAYIKSIDMHGNTRVSLVSSKSRVAPVKSLTIPRLELCAAVLLSKLVKKVLSAMKETVSKVYLWTDSTIVLSWLQKDPSDLKCFVQTRIVKILDYTNLEQWHHIRSEQNPADVLSRGLNSTQLINCGLWWRGPDFLKCSDYPCRSMPLPENNEEINCELKPNSKTLKNIKTFNITVKFEFVQELTKLSNNYVIILRILSFIYRFISNCKPGSERETGPLTVKELTNAERFLIKSVQRDNFAADIQSLQLRGTVANVSKLKSLSPFLDDTGILRVGGRLKYASIHFERKHPAILPKGNKFTLVIIDYYHKKYLHAGPTCLLGIVREKFWPINGRAMCRKVVHQCIPCFKSKPIIASQLMGNLPKDRVHLDYCFNICGVDLCGPLTIKIRYARRTILQKIYVCIFVCFVFKAVHIELISDLTSESFIAALKRFIARRGKCAKLYSDNATNFVGANKLLKQFLNLVRGPDDKLAAYLSNEGIEWNFIPPRAPNFGGLWEAAIKSFKYHLKRIVGKANLTYEELLTVAVQIEGVLNSRPVSPLSADEEDFEILTPAHFLINRPLNSIVEPDLTNLRESHLKKWQKITRIVQLFWRKWHKNYLSELQQRGKWRFEKDNIKLGDLVLLVEEDLPTNKWPLGRIIEVYYGNDRKIRVVNVKTQNGTFKRSITKVCILPMPD